MIEIKLIHIEPFLGIWHDGHWFIYWYGHAI